MKTKHRIYFCFPLSGPNNGVKVISSYIFTELIKEDIFELIPIDTSQAKGFNNFGKFNFTKIIHTLNLFYKLFNIAQKDFVYLNLTPKGFAFYRDFIMILISKLKGGNVTVHLHANDLEKKFNSFTKFFLKRVKIIVINELQYHKLKKQHSDLYLVKNALPDFFKAIKINNYLKDDKIRLLFFSNLSKEKGIYRLESIIKLIGNSDLKCEISIYGGILDKANESIFDDLKLKYNFINYYGAITDEKEKFNIFTNNNFLLFLSDIDYEVSPLVYIEALMSGLPIITTKQVVSDDIVNAKCGFHISEDCKELLNILQAYKVDGIEKKELKNRCRELYLKIYSFDNYINLIKKIIIK